MRITISTGYINLYPGDSATDFPITYPLDSGIQRLNNWALVDSATHGHLLNNRTCLEAARISFSIITKYNGQTFRFRLFVCLFLIFFRSSSLPALASKLTIVQL